MMTVKETPPVFFLNLFTASKSIRFLSTLKRLQFSGELVFTDPKGQQWFFYLYLGNIMYATGVTHSVRRWQRNLAIHCPQIPAESVELQRDLAKIDAAKFSTCWEYQLLCLWVTQQKITREQATKIIRGVIAEVLFDVAQAMRVVYQINQESSSYTPLVWIDLQEAIAQVQQLWQSWQDAHLVNYSPNLAPIIRQPDELRKRTSSQVYYTLIQLLKGQYTLRDLAVQMNRDVVQVTLSLLPYIKLGLVELISIPDLSAVVSPLVPKTPIAPAQPTGPLIACVDDSPLVCQTMEVLLTASGYRFVGIDDALRAFAVLIAHKPDVIFLDLVMPNANGYEICTKLRKLDYFRNTPILILTGNDGIVDRVRAKLVGASDFLSKPINAGTVLNVIRKHLEQGAISR
ncbi:MAG TPA: response regulator [Coleofasciculaceae cyanobacterium]|jgi:chemotaxis family two-component system response regulator PixG